MCDAADGTNVSGGKTVSQYSADHQAESFGIAGSSLLCSGFDLTAPPLIMLHLYLQGSSGKNDLVAMTLEDIGAIYNFILLMLAKLFE